MSAGAGSFQQPPSAGPGQQAYGQQPQYAQAPPQGQADLGMPQNIAALLCYAFGILSAILFLVIEPFKNDRLIRFHAWQSLLLFGGLFVTNIAITIISMIAAKILGILALLFSLVSMVLGLAALVLWVMLMIKAYQGQRWVLPFIGPIAEQKAA